MGDFWKPTSDMFSGLIDKPKMTEKLLSKPPFKYIFDIIIQTSKKTNFGRNLYSGEQLNGDYYKDRDTKIFFLTKIIQLVEMMGAGAIEAKPQKIVAGLQPENTNLMLQSIYKCATSGKNSDSFVNKILGGAGGADQEQEQSKKKQPEKKKVQRPPSAARLKKPADQPASKKVVQPQQQPQSVKQVTKQVKKPVQQQKPGKKQEYSQKVQQLMQEGQQQQAKQKGDKKKQQEQPQGQGKNKLGNLRKKKKGDNTTSDKIITSGGQLNEKQLQMLQGMIQTICQNTAPLGKSIEFINDDVEAMNKQLQFWRRQYNASKTKMQNQLKISQQSLLPVYDKIAQIQDQIKDQKAKIQNAKAQIIKNDSKIRDLLMSVVTTK